MSAPEPRSSPVAEYSTTTRLQARYNRLVRRFGGDKNPAGKKKAITAITPCSRSPTRSSRAARPTRNWVRASAPGGNPRSRSRPGWSASCKSSTPAAPSPSPSARRRPHYQPALKPQARFRQPRSHRRPGTPALPPDKPASLLSPHHRTGEGSLPRAHRGPSYRVRPKASTGPGDVQVAHAGGFGHSQRRAGRWCRGNSRFPYSRDDRQPTKIIASANGCRDPFSAATPRPTQPLPAPVRYQHLLEGVEVLNAFARAEHDRFQAECRPGRPASLFLRPAAHPGRATAHHLRSGRYRGP